MNVLIDYRLIGRRIRACRRQAHLTQAELAERTGVCHQFIGCLERGEGIPSLGTVMSLCSALEIDPNTLLLDCYIDNPEASCSLRDLPSEYANTLTALWMEAACSPAHSDASIRPDAFPPHDIPLEDIGRAENFPE